MKNNKKSTVEIWFGGRKNKKLLELKIDNSSSDAFIDDILSLCDKYDIDARKLWKPDREPDATLSGFDFWFEEGLVRSPYANPNHVERFFIKTPDIKENKPAELMFQCIKSRRQVVKPYKYSPDSETHEKLLNDVLNTMILGDIE